MILASVAAHHSPETRLAHPPPTRRYNGSGSIVTTSSAEDKARAFLAQASQFQLGDLPTESRHPKTMQLSQLAQHELTTAIGIMAGIDRDAVRAVATHIPALETMTADIRATLTSGGRVFLCGCGATGRLSISLEALWREEAARTGRPDLANQVFSFIAGGDFALVRSIDNFEDHAEFGARQLHDLGFAGGDLLIANTEGGETPFVIGATEEAARAGRRKPYFLFCNPAGILRAIVERSRRVLDNPLIHSISIPTGPMALSGSTRLQATTAGMLATGAALFAATTPNGSPATWIDECSEVLATAGWKALAPLIEQESAIYANREFCVHRTSRYGITVLTDTTERTPTFSLFPFENALDDNSDASWTYLSIPDTTSALEAWERVLGRRPRPVNWDGYRERFGMERTLGYDFSANSLERRRRQLGRNKVHVVDIADRDADVVFSIGGAEARFRRPLTLLCEHLQVKCAMNIASTLVMGRLNRFYGNVMVFVRPTNNKLVDRSIRFIRLLLEDEGLSPLTYEEVCRALFEEFEASRADEPVVVRTFERLKARARMTD
jgi:N-acetylmuramic acid 6-phosphate etherase